MIERLLEYARLNQHRFKEAKVGYADSGAVNPERRRSLKLKNFGELKVEIEGKIRSALPTLFEKLGSPPFVPFDIELELIAHGDGAFFALHKDTFGQTTEAQSHRVISAVYYFHELPKAFSDGVLRLHPLAPDPSSNSHVDIEPLNDTLVFFPSWFPHEVTLVKCPSRRFEDSRFAINCWIHRKTSPIPG